MNDKFSSFKLACSSNEAGGRVIFFENINWLGRYKSWQVNNLGVPETDVPWIVADFNDITSSTFIVRRFENEIATPFANFVDPQSFSVVAQGVRVVAARGSPTAHFAMQEAIFFHTAQ